MSMERNEYVIRRIQELEVRYVRIATLKKKQEEIVYIRRLSELKRKTMIEYAALVAELASLETRSVDN